MYPNNSQFSFRADGMPEAMPPSVFERNNPKPKATPKVTTPSKPSGGLSIPKENNYKPVGSGASAWVGGAMGGGGGAMGRK